MSYRGHVLWVESPAAGNRGQVKFLTEDNVMFVRELWSGATLQQDLEAANHYATLIEIFADDNYCLGMRWIGALDDVVRHVYEARDGA